MSDALALVSLLISAVLAFLNALNRALTAQQFREHEHRLRDLEQELDRLRPRQPSPETLSGYPASQLPSASTTPGTAPASLAWGADRKVLEEALRPLHDQLSSLLSLLQSAPAQPPDPPAVHARVDP
jgi:hypothetical protein